MRVGLPSPSRSKGHGAQPRSVPALSGIATKGSLSLISCKTWARAYLAGPWFPHLGFLHASLAGGIRSKAPGSLLLLLAAAGPGSEEELPSWGLCYRELSSRCQLTPCGAAEGSSLPGEPSGPVGFWHGPPPAAGDLLSAYGLALTGPSWNVVNESCSFQGPGAAPTGLPSLVSQRRGRNPGKCWKGRERVQSLSPGRV